MPDQQKLFHSDTLALSPDAKPKPFTTVECFCGRRFRLADFRAMDKLCDRCKEDIINAGGRATVNSFPTVEIRYIGGDECQEDQNSAA